MSWMGKMLTGGAAAALILMGLGTARAGAPGNATYAKDVAPILNRSCVECHRPGQIGPMSLTSYQEVRPWAKAIQRAVNEGSMPPWFSDDTTHKFANEKTLTESEIETINAWIAARAPMGDPTDLPPTPEFADGAWLIGPPDQIFEMPQPYAVSDELEDYYHYVSIPTNFTEDKWINAIELHPGDRGVVHHILVFMVPHGADPHSVDSNLNLLGKYAPGNNPDVFPAGHGKKIPANSDLVFQIHYHKEPGAGTATLDQSRIGVKYADGPVEHPITTAWILNPNITIPPGATDYTLTSTFRFIDNGEIFALGPHMHLRGRTATYTAEYPDGTTEVLLNVPEYDFNWQINYYFKEPKQVPRGTKVHFTAVYDNSANNPYNPDPTQTVVWGDTTTDEMMIGYMDYKYEKRKEFQRTLALPEGMLASHFGRDSE